MQQHDELIKHPAVLIGFSLAVLIMLLLDLGVFNKKSHEVSSKEALTWSIVWISLAMIFSGVIYYTMDFDSFAKFQSAYWIEKALSVDNLFVFILVFRSFKTPKKLHHKALFWGVIGALVFRAIFIFAGVALIKKTYLPEMDIFGKMVSVNVVLTIFGFFLLYAGIKSWFAKSHQTEEPSDTDYQQNIGARIIQKLFRVSKNYHGDRFFTREHGKRVATRLLLVLGVIEFTDLIFAVDSIPAIFAIAPDDPFILYTSNIFAILGLRALYFLLANFIDRFSKLKYGLALILSFIGVKMLIQPFYHFSEALSLSIVGGVLLISVLVSLLTTRKSAETHSEEHLMQ